MLNWICPDCGRECPPTSRECPSCVPVGVVQTTVAIAEEPQPVQPPPAIENGRHNGHRDGGPEPPHPTPENLQAMVEQLEEQISGSPALEIQQAALTSWVETAEPLEPEWDEASAAMFAAAQQAYAAELLDVQDAEAETRKAILRIAESFTTCGPAALLNPAREEIQAPAPMQTNCIAAARPKIAPRRPEWKPVDAPALPQALLLPGPILPHDLSSLAGIRAKARERVRNPKRAGVPAWMISVTVVTVMILGLASVMQTHSADRNTTPPGNMGTSAAVPGEAPVPPEHPLARYVEIAGLRIVADLPHRSQLQYIVVNHSATTLEGLALQIAVRSPSPDDSDKTPLFQVSAVVQTLGPYQSKEMRTDLGAQIDSKAVPDWQNLKADVQVTAGR